MTHSRLKYDPKKCGSFRIGCDMGDQIYSLMIAKKMGTKAYYVDGDGAVYNGRDGKDYIVAWESKSFFYFLNGLLILKCSDILGIESLVKLLLLKLVSNLLIIIVKTVFLL